MSSTRSRGISSTVRSSVLPAWYAGRTTTIFRSPITGGPYSNLRSSDRTLVGLRARRRPRAMRDEPRDRLAETGRERRARRPAELGLDLRWIDRVPEVVPRAIGHE